VCFLPSIGTAVCAAFENSESSCLAVDLHCARAVTGLSNVVPHPASFAASEGATLAGVTEFINPDGLFAALDGRDVSASGGQWRIEVFGIADDDHDRWVQLALNGRQRYLVTLRLHAGCGTQRAVAALAGWLAHPEEAAPPTD
jgi:hypothetical protein